MPRLDLNSRRKVILLHNAGISIKCIEDRLKDEGTVVTRRSLQRLVKKHRETGMYKDLFRRKRDKKITDDMNFAINNELEANDEATARQLRNTLVEKYPSLNVSLSTIKRKRKQLGWVCTRPHYCQLIRELNKVKRVVWCKEQLRVKEDFSNVVFTDECTIQLEHHGQLCFRKQFHPRKLKPRPKHPLKLHVWGAISPRGAASIVMFTGTMDAIRFGEILDASLIPFLSECFPDGHRFQMDNDPKHRSQYIADYFQRHAINWWATPPESPDLNPIENVWGSTKQFLRTACKPHNLEELKQGILTFWQSLTPTVCRKYINHLHKVIPKVIELDGGPSGY